MRLFLLMSQIQLRQSEHAVAGAHTHRITL